MKKYRTYKPWTELACDRCGNQFLFTRTEPKILPIDQELICSDCQIYQDSYDEGYQKGREDFENNISNAIITFQQNIINYVYANYDDFEFNNKGWRVNGFWVEAECLYINFYHFRDHKRCDRSIFLNKFLSFNSVEEANGKKKIETVEIFDDPFDNLACD